MNLLFRAYDAVAGPAAREACGTAGLRPCAEKLRVNRRGVRKSGGSFSAPAAILSSKYLNVFIPVIICLLLFGSPSSVSAVPVGTPIINTATAAYLVGASPATATSNTLIITSVAMRTPSTLELLQHAPASGSATPVMPTDYSTLATTAGPWPNPLAPPTAVGGGPINIGLPVPLLPATQYHITEAVFIRLTDPDQNLDPLAAETVFVTVRDAATGDTEVLRLTETGPDTGVFTGYIQTGTGPAANGSGVLNCQADSRITASYTDIADGTDNRSASILVDPNGLVFNSTTGLPVDGAVITIIDTATGLPATVFADDGTTPFPATVVSGSTFTVGATTYTFPPGGYRFPFVAPGSYQYQLIPPANYRAPSVVATTVIQALPGGPFAIVTGSRGEVFIVDPGPALHIDVPLDPTGLKLYIVKTAGKTSAAQGDFIPYRVTVENTDPASTVSNIILTDLLPHGFRYRTGSGRLNGAAFAEPSVSPDGRTLTFRLGSLATGQKASVTYVAELGAGAKPGTAKNIAVAAGDLGASSNIAMASVEVREDLFRSRSTIVGQLLLDGCGDPARAPDKAEKIIAEGVRVLLEDGTSSVTDRNGMFHFEAVKPGTHVVQLDLDTLPPGFEAALCSENDRFAGRGFSQFVELQGGALWRADFHLALMPKMRGNVVIELTSHIPAPPQAVGKKENEGPRNRLEYHAVIQNTLVPLRNVRLTVMLPPGVAYLPGSSRLGDAPLADPFIMENALTYRLPDVAGDWTGTVRFETMVTPQTGADSLVARALLTVDTPDAASVRTPVAENLREIQVLEKRMAVPDMVLHPRFRPLSTQLSKQDSAALNKVIRKLRPLTIQHLSVVGHSDSIPIRGKGLKKFKDNYELSEARAKAIAEYFAKALKLKPGQVEIIAKGSDEPVATNDTPKGRAQNRRVELKVYKELVISFAEVAEASASSGGKTVETVGLRPGAPWPLTDPAAVLAGTDTAQTPKPDELAALLDNSEPGLALLRPEEGHHPPIPSIKIVVKHAPSSKLFLGVNGRDVDPVLYDGTVKSRDGGMAASLWRGVPLNEGDNILTVLEYGANGTKLGEITRTIHYSGPPVKAALIPERSSLIADGRTPPVIALRLTDKDGHPAREGVVGEYSVDPPHLPRQREEDLQRTPLVAPVTDRLQYVAGKDGVALIELRPSTRTGDAVVRLNLVSGLQEVRAWLKPADRDWVLVGLAEGTAGHNTLTGNMEGLTAAEIEDKLYTDGHLAFYAKGKVLGKWLLTMAYDSGREWRKDEQSLHQLVDPNRYYTLYGDATTQQSDAPSSRPLYIKLEREQFYVLFGDYATGLTVTELSRYNRNFNGLKTELKSDTLDVTAFASDTAQAFVKDELRGDGTSGLFRLSRRNIVMNSETVTIETRDRYRSEVIVSSQRMSRWLDYTIDYESGTLFFKAPVPSRDENFNPVYIVADYESFDNGDRSWTSGGRVAVRPKSKAVELGMTYVHEGAIGAGSDLTGIDTTIKLDERTTVRAEAAVTKSVRGAVTEEGEAYLAEVLHRSSRLEGKAYVRDQDGNFGLGQQNGSETGTRKIGLDATYRLTAAAAVRGQAFRQYNLSTGAIRDMAELQAGYDTRRYSASAGFRFAEDDLTAGLPRTSEQVFAAARYRLNDRLGLTLGHDQSLSGENGNSDFPTRTTLGAEYQLNSSTSFLAAQELAQRAAGRTATTRIGFRSSPWTGGSLNSSVEDRSTENGTRLFAVTGLKQSWTLNSRWSVDAGLDRAATIRQTGQAASVAAPFNVNVPPASGGEDFTAVSLGAGYKAERWSWTGRIENRHAATEDKLGFLMGAAGEPRQGLGLSGAVQVFRTDSVTGSERDIADIRLGLVYRPAETRWIVLDRLDYIVEEQKDAASRFENWRIVNNLVVNYSVLPSTQVSFQYGAKYVSETIEEQDYSGYTDLTGLETRYDITPKWDVGARGSVLHTWSSGQKDYSAGVSTGYSIAQNMWFSVGYNFLGFKDKDFSKADYTADGAYLKLRVKFDQISVRDAVKWFSGQ